MAAPRAKTSPQSSPAGDYDEQTSDEDLCGYGCHAEGVPEGAVSAGCEHGTYEVTATTKRKAIAADARRPETVHDRDLHHAVEEASAANDVVVGLVNAHDERLLAIEAEVRRQAKVIEQLVELAAGASDGE